VITAISCFVCLSIACALKDHLSLGNARNRSGFTGNSAPDRVRRPVWNAAPPSRLSAGAGGAGVRILNTNRALVLARFTVRLPVVNAARAAWLPAKPFAANMLGLAWVGPVRFLASARRAFATMTKRV
jgi:hypothetical protein